MNSPNDYPFVSVIVPVYNAQQTLSDCLHALTNQAYPSNCYEIIVVNNKSTDLSMSIAQKFDGVCILNEELIQSSYASRNRGIQNAKGEFIAFTDADCIPDANWLKQLVFSFNADPMVVGVAGEVKAYEPKTITEFYQDHMKILSPHFLSSAQADVIACTCNVMYKISTLKAVGCFNDRWISGADFDLAYRILQQHKGKIVLNKEAIVFHKHRTNIRNFFQQNYRFGIGRRCLQEQDYRLLIKGYWDRAFFMDAITRLPSTFLKTIFIFFQSIIKRRPLYKATFPWFEWMERVALCLGFLKGKGHKGL
jgi:glycosyltransferase involved in cell wall biosynthesis